MRTFFAFLFVAILPFTVSAQSMGPDVTVSSLTDVAGYGQALGITAFAVGTVACNVGNQPVTWNSGNNQHPVIAQNMYRLSGGRFQQLGMSWLKHGFVSTNSPGCGTCQQPPLGGGQLGVGCTDAYSSSLNGSNTSLGPRSEVNASTGVFLIPHGVPSGNSTIKGRIQVQNTDLGVAGALYFAEAQYVTQDDATAGNKNNNATWQQIVSPAVGVTGNVAFIGAPQPQQPAIYAWQAQDAAVVITTVDFPNDGRFLIGKRVTSLGGGNFHYEIAVHNLNSDRSGRKLTVAFAPGTTISNAGFRSIPYHSGEPYASTAWTIGINGSTIDWATDLWLTNANANALRWGTMYNFWFDATAAAETSKTIELFKPAVPCSVVFTSPLGPGSIQMDHTVCPAASGNDYFIAVTQTQGAYPNGWLYGVDISFPELADRIAAGYPFVGSLDGTGAATFGPISGLPSGMTIYAVSMNTSPGLGQVYSHRPKLSYTIP